MCDERGVQGGLEGRAGTALGAVFGAQNQDLKLGALRVLCRQLNMNAIPSRLPTLPHFVYVNDFYIHGPVVQECPLSGNVT